MESWIALDWIALDWVALEKCIAQPAHPPRAQQTGTGGYRRIWVTAAWSSSDGYGVSASVRKVFFCNGPQLPDTDSDARLVHL